MRRMDRYKEEENHVSRLDKNQDLYQNISSNAVYTNITDVTNANAFEIGSNEQSNVTSHTTREAYQKMRKYQNVEPVPRNKKELDDFNYIYQQQENKIYDINSVLEQARKNRGEKDARDGKRMLKNNEYNILSGVNKEALEKYREEKKKRMLTPEEEGIRELIDTIASKTLAGEIDKETTVDLLSDLMATNMLDVVEGMENKHDEIKQEEIKENKVEEESKEENKEKQEIKEEGLNQEQIDEIEKRKEDPVDKLPEKDNDFYTRSMDLSDKDFEFGDIKEKSLPFIVKLIIFLLIIAVIAVAGYFIYQRIK